VHVLRSHRWLLARLFSWMRFSMKSTASTLRAVTARGPVNRPMPAPSSKMRFSSTLPSIASTYEQFPLMLAFWLMPSSELLGTLALQRFWRWAFDRMVRCRATGCSKHPAPKCSPPPCPKHCHHLITKFEARTQLQKVLSCI